MLLSLDRRGEGTSHNRAIAAGLAAMGVLDGLHACVDVGNLFVWLHSTASLGGGVLLALCWVPDRFLLGRLPPYWVAAGALLFGLTSIAFGDRLPAMVRPTICANPPAQPPRSPSWCSLRKATAWTPRAGSG